ncbi:hypothetical protein ERO13_D08G070033v2 [Gossypium hirsutum]|uniref:Neprosin activation peptide domain-containing protein n=3 Tax=Gossypium TaxID=3633 RepID=A0A5D2TSJ2_GOSMU|nr:hypothetical protein ERO13_D08G070033v2 [Gossypium hirsutum]TYH57238.1 hypothetical protein ES332_D08G075900v1 [Gossypium tomentosum]TYI68222.1 hypothetical protein E1A91_D08G074900v1 [Gossypium mustelinum]
MRCLHLFLVITVVFFLVRAHQCESSRVLNEDTAALKSFEKEVVPLPPSGHNGCTYIPDAGGTPCTNERALVDHVMTPPRRLLPDSVPPLISNESTLFSLLQQLVN